MLRTVAAFFVLIVVIMVLSPVGFVLMLLSFAGLSRATTALVFFIGRMWACCLIKMSGCAVSAHGQENIPRRGGLCFISNHSGYFDILLMLAYAKRPFGFMAKKELSYIPLLNMWILLLGGHFIDRKNPRKALVAINRGVSYIEKGGAMIIFPEGTRSKGRGLLPFHAGSFKLAARSNAPVVPVAIMGSYEMFERQGRIVPSPVAISFGTPIDTGSLEDKKQALCSAVYTRINEMLTNL